ncbi:hypothetical protein I3760_15G001000 [Carya illinoinensis]|nr:hypothetical protein I3760_15G001000 [Carya illinoinensis]
MHSNGYNREFCYVPYIHTNGWHNSLITLICFFLAMTPRRSLQKRRSYSLSHVITLGRSIRKLILVQRI